MYELFPFASVTPGEALVKPPVKILRVSAVAMFAQKPRNTASMRATLSPIRVKDMGFVKLDEVI